MAYNNSREAHIKKCEACHKLCFTSRKQAKRYLHRRFPKSDMTVYRCRENPTYFHYGHTPWGVRRGIKERGGRIPA